MDLISLVRQNQPELKLFDIIHEDRELLVVNKPAGLVVHPTKTDAYSSLISRARLHLGPSSNPQLVNRLDRETSGLVLIAKTNEVARGLRRIWEDRLVTKVYLAIVHGHVSSNISIIDAPLGKDEVSRVAIKDCVRPDGAPAKTELKVLRHFLRVPATGQGSEPPGAMPFSLLQVTPHTGRKHQIRIHLAFIGHSIVGDKIYGLDEGLYLALVNGCLSDEHRSRLLTEHHALHAASIEFCWRNRPVHYAADPEPWFQDFYNESL